MPRFFRICLSALFLLSIPGTAKKPAPGQGLRLSLPLAIRIALKNNIEARIAKIRLLQARNNLAGTLRQFDIRPYLTGDIDLYGPDDSTRIGKIGIGVSKKFRWGTDMTVAMESSIYGNMDSTYGSDPAYKSGFTVSFSQALLQGGGSSYILYGYNTASWTIREKRIALGAELSKIVRDTELAYWKHLYARRNERIARISLKLAVQLLEMNRLRVRIGLMSETDLIEAQSVQALREEELLHALNEVKATRDNLLALLHMEKHNIDTLVLLTSPGKPRKSAPLAKLIRDALLHNPDCRLALINLKKNDLDLAYFRNLTRPTLDLDLSLSVFGQDSRFAPSFGPGDYSVSLGLRFALPGGSDARENLKNARFNRQALSLRESAIRRDLVNRVRANVRNMDSAASRITAASRARDLAKKRLDLTVQKFNLKLASNTDILEAQKNYLEAILSYEKAVLEYHEESARLKFECGTNLEQHGIRLDKSGSQ